MNKKELIFLTIAIIILLACISTIPQYFFAFIFLLVLAILFIIMTLFDGFKSRFENHTLSLISYVIGIILFVVYFVNSINFDFSIKGSSFESSLILLLFFIVMCIGWLLEKNRN
ncbi:hypothetical protein [Methanobrevibacter sp.]|uniref:hypothetical protein n=1 Tax=Methanobrevibacter sp. TaxID=66852 RepID=UPI00388D874D